MSELPTVYRPGRFTYSLRHLRKLPTRLLCPSDAGVGIVRSFRVVPKFKVSLDDVLNGRHLPPLTLKEFEEYLLFIEHSAENLYFWAWLKKYDDTFARYNESRLTSDEPVAQRASDDTGKEMILGQELRQSYACAHATFLAANAPMQLNLTSDAVSVAPLPPLPSALHDEPPSPETLAPIKQQVIVMLQSSLSAFVVDHCRNGGRRRGLFAIVVGLLICLLAILPVAQSFERSPRGTHRYLSFAAFPCLWFGITTLIAGFHGVCIVIFMFGDARQLRPYEMRQPTEAEIAQIRRSMSIRSSDKSRARQAVSLGSAHDDQKYDDIQLQHSSGELASLEFGKDVGAIPHRINTADLTHSAIDVSLSSSSSHAIAPWLASPDPSASGSSHWDWEIAPCNSGSLLLRQDAARNGVMGIFAPMQEALNPIVSRAQWIIIMRSASIGVVLGLIVCGICAAPFPGT
ncbi:hypothetical protein BKA62DRAFT_684496 [Auriculariales sp. MPI-PUGE-AT-0066]|nr:hypothetical protein BKA62DRAFT_684496 [Auriculariales sp. MPI-PUGE-AT-0066]